METVCDMAQKRRNFDTPGVGPFGFNKKNKEKQEDESDGNSSGDE
jgi:hypothetical protein